MSIAKDRLVIDASVVLKSYLPEEGSIQAQAIFYDCALRHVEIFAPDLITYEVMNALLVAVRRHRLASARGEEILREFSLLALPTHSMKRLEGRVWALAQEYQRTAYDAAYLALAEREKALLVTGDRRLYNAVKNKLKWVQYIEDYKPKAPKAAR